MEKVNEISYEDIEARLLNFGIDLSNEIDKKPECSDIIFEQLELINSNESSSKDIKLESIIIILSKTFGFKYSCCDPKQQKVYNLELNFKNYKEETKSNIQFKNLKDSQIV